VHATSRAKKRRPSPPLLLDSQAPGSLVGSGELHRREAMVELPLKLRA
jgi:hypothetical protein